MGVPAARGQLETPPVTGDRLYDHLAADLASNNYAVDRAYEFPKRVPGLYLYPTFVGTRGSEQVLAFVVPSRAETSAKLVADWQTCMKKGYHVTVACGDRATFDRVRELAHQARLPVRFLYFDRHRRHHSRHFNLYRYVRRRGGQYVLWVVALLVMQLALVLSFRACEVVNKYKPNYYEPKDIEREMKRQQDQKK
ncbi:MAG: hypothetical protein ACR2L2_12420 [Acidobacteriota bacterium]